MSFLSLYLNSLLMSQQTLSHCVVCVSKFSKSCNYVSGKQILESDRRHMSPIVNC